MSIILSAGTAVPRYRCLQSEVGKFMEDHLGPDPLQKKILKAIYSQSAINSRYSVLPDFTCSPAERILFSSADDLEPVPNLEKRLSIYDQEAPKLAVAAVKDCLERSPGQSNITHLITVSCTGMSAPGLDIA